MGRGREGIRYFGKMEKSQILIIDFDESIGEFGYTIPFLVLFSKQEFFPVCFLDLNVEIASIYVFRKNFQTNQASMELHESYKQKFLSISDVFAFLATQNNAELRSAIRDMLSVSCSKNCGMHFRAQITF